MEHTAIVPHTRSGVLGAVLSALSLAILVVVLALDSPDTGRNPLAFAWAFIVLSGAVELYAIIRQGERSLLGFLALLPFAGFAALLLMEITGLME